jgi:mono/diheme cytochrome c family protein
MTASRSRLSFLLLATVTGCAPAPDPVLATPTALAPLSAELKPIALEQLEKHAGTFAAPRIVGRDDVPLEHLKHGQAVYQLRCAQCHGDSGDGNGPVADQMYPRPRDYQKGIFKFTSTGYGAKPLRSDLVRTLQRGIRGTSMPAFNLLPMADLEAVVDYVLVLTHRGELAETLAYLADTEGELGDELVQSDAVPPIVERWKAARETVIVPLTPEPELTAERAAHGRELFLKDSVGCLKCHGEDGRGRTPDNLKGDLRDRWGHPTRAADLTSGFLRGGQEPIDIYRRIMGGINGTPMPAFANAFRESPDDVWDLVAYVKFITNRRRAGEMPGPGTIKPFIPEGFQSTGASGGTEAGGE